MKAGFDVRRGDGEETRTGGALGGWRLVAGRSPNSMTKNETLFFIPVIFIWWVSKIFCVAVFHSFALFFFCRQENRQRFRQKFCLPMRFLSIVRMYTPYLSLSYYNDLGILFPALTKWCLLATFALLPYSLVDYISLCCVLFDMIY